MLSNLQTHTGTDDKFIERLTSLYDELLSSDNNNNPESGLIILDIMSSHISHLPHNKLSNGSFARVDVHGMNQDELEANMARVHTNGYVLVRDLNENPSLLDLNIAKYDAVLCCVGVQYLQEAEALFAEVGRILKPGGIVIISFTNKFLYQKALVGWMERGMKERARLVTDYIRAAGGFQNIHVVGNGTNIMTQLLSLGGLAAGDPSAAVVATRDETP
jgi:SAM-dependent methyltransferase